MGYLFDRSRIYIIRVAGVLDKNWSNRLGGLEIVNSESEEDTAIPVTTLTGPLSDQAALLGTLNALYDMHYPLLSVEYLGEIETTSP